MSIVEITSLGLLSLISFLILLLFIKDFDLLKKIRDNLKRFMSRNQAENIIAMINSINTAVTFLSETGHGSIIVIEKKDNTSDLFMEPQHIDSKINSNLIINIFGGDESQPLHDGAIVISKNRIKTANAFAKKLTTNTIDRKYGARHRAAIGISEQCDAIVLVTSEERKGITIVTSGKVRTIDVSELFDTLSEYILGVVEVNRK